MANTSYQGTLGKVGKLPKQITDVTHSISEGAQKVHDMTTKIDAALKKIPTYNPVSGAVIGGLSKTAGALDSVAAKAETAAKAIEAAGTKVATAITPIATAAASLNQSLTDLQNCKEVLNASSLVVDAVVNSVTGHFHPRANEQAFNKFDKTWDSWARVVNTTYENLSPTKQKDILETLARANFGDNLYALGSAIKNESAGIFGGIADFEDSLHAFRGSYRNPVEAAKKIETGVKGIINATERVANSVNNMIKTYQDKTGATVTGNPILAYIGNLHNTKAVSAINKTLTVGGGAATLWTDGVAVTNAIKSGDLKSIYSTGKKTIDDTKTIIKGLKDNDAATKVTTLAKNNTPSSQTTKSLVGSNASRGGTTGGAAPLQSSNTSSQPQASGNLQNNNSQSANSQNNNSQNSNSQNSNSQNSDSQNSNSQNSNSQNNNSQNNNSQNNNPQGGGGNSYVCSGATMKCTMGTSQARLTVLPIRMTYLTGQPMANISDHTSFVNLGAFGRCRSLGFPATASATAAAHGKLTPMPCVHNTPFPWMGGKNDYLVQNQPALLKSSKCQCMWGGTISLVTDGQVGEGVQWVQKKPRENFQIISMINQGRKVLETDVEKQEYDRVATIILGKYNQLASEEKDRALDMINKMPNNLTNLEKLAIAERNLKLEKQLGQPMGERMSISEADKQKANPHYDPDASAYQLDPEGPLEDKEGNRYRYDPDPKYEYSINCATCAPAYALRLMGFDITAKGNTEGSLNEWLSENHSFDIWENIDGSKPQPSITYDWMKENGLESMSSDDYKKYFDDTCKEEGVYVLTLFWATEGGHATILQRDHDGNLYWIEPQVYDSEASQDGKRTIDDFLSHNGGLHPNPYPARRVKDANGNTCYDNQGEPIVIQEGIMRVDNKLLKDDGGFVALFDQ